MHPDCRQLFKRDPFELLSSHDEKCRELNERAPKTIDFLSEESRAHFQEVLEYLEALNIPVRNQQQLDWKSEILY